MNGNLQRFPDVPLGVAIVTHGPVAVAALVVVVAALVVPVAALVVPVPVEPGQEESQ